MRLVVAWRTPLETHERTKLEETGARFNSGFCATELKDEY
jgi:hypothetical protein